MAPGRASNSKRKRSDIPDPNDSTSPATPRKRQKKNAHQPAGEGIDEIQLIESSDESEPFYEARAIIREDKRRYLIDWADNPETGESYPPSWQPKRNANKELVEDWKRRKRPKKKGKRQRQVTVSSPRRASGSFETHDSPGPAPAPATTSGGTSRPRKRDRVVQSSSPEPELDRPPASSSISDDGERVIPETASRNSRSRSEAEVIITRPPDYDPADYEHFSASQIPWGSSQATFPSASQPTQSTANSQQVSDSDQSNSESYNIPAERLLQPPRFGDGALVPDSQSLPGDSSYVPSTQTWSGAESQLAQSQPQLAEPATTQPQTDSSASASAQFTNSQEQNDSSAPVPETDPIEDAPSSPAERSHQEEQLPLQRESPWHSSSSASSPPPTESPDKADKSQNQSGEPDSSLGVQVETHSAAAANEGTQVSEAEPESRPLSPKTRPQEQDQAAPELAPAQEESSAERVTQDCEIEEETFAVPNTAEEPVETAQTEGQEEFGAGQATTDHETGEEGLAVPNTAEETAQLQEQEDPEVTKDRETNGEEFFTAQSASDEAAQAPEQEQTEEAIADREVGGEQSFTLQQTPARTAEAQQQEGSEEINRDQEVKEQTFAVQRPSEEAAQVLEQEELEVIRDLDIAEEAVQAQEQESGAKRVTADREAEPEETFVQNPAEQTAQEQGQEQAHYQAESSVEQTAKDREAEGEEPLAVQDTAKEPTEEIDQALEEERSAQRTIESEVQESNQPNPAQEGVAAQEDVNVNTGDIENAETNAQEVINEEIPEQREIGAFQKDTIVNTGDIGNVETNFQQPVSKESPGQQQTEKVTQDEPAISGEVPHFVTGPENQALTEAPDPAETLTQDVTDPADQLYFQHAQRDFVFEPDSSSAAVQGHRERTNSQRGSQQWQSAQYVPEIDLDNPQSGNLTDSTGSRPSEFSRDSRQKQKPKRKDSSQDSVEPSVLSQADPNIIRHPPQREEPDFHPKNIVRSIESRAETPIRGYYRKSSRGMPQTPQPPNSSVGNIGPTTPKSLTEEIRKVVARNKAECEKKKAEVLVEYKKAAPKSPALEASTRSPSVIPPQPPQPDMESRYTLMSSNLSAESRPDEGNQPHAQDEHSLPDVHHPGNDTEMQDASSTSVLLEDPIVGDDEYLIGLSMEGLQGDQYRREIGFKKDEITDFTNNDPPDESSILGVRELLEKVGNVITHMDLGYANEDSLTQYDDNSRALVGWSNNSSTKFRFLGGILDRLRDSKMHFVILSRAGALMDIIETFVCGMGIQYSRGGNVNHRSFEARDSLFVTILATDCEFVDPSLPTAQLIFAMDSTVRCNEPKMKALRNHLRGPKNSIPVITPIATNSLEHVERCISPSLQGMARERLVVRFMTELRQLAGRVEVSTKADHAVNLIVPSIETDLDHHETWPLPRVGSIKPDVHFDESMISSLSVSSSVPMGTMNSSAGQKRHLEVREDEPAKRTRLTPQPEAGTVNPNDITRISDSVPGVAQAHGLSSNSTQDEHIRTYRKDEKLRKELKYTKDRLKEFEESLETCQTEKEEQKELIFHLKKENTTLKESQINYSERIKAQNNNIESLRNERDTFKEQLDAARKQLETSSIPEVAEREQLRRERDEALARLERAQKTRETENKESEFFRSQYQDASNRASELSADMVSLTQQLREFERLASGERERARQLTLDAAANAYKGEVEMLRAQLHDREEIIRQKTDEIKAIRGRQGVGTRAGSVPRSPRISGPGSRGGSPAPSGLGGHGRLGALRNINA